MEARDIEKLRIDTFTATILGLLTVGCYWVIFLIKWLHRNESYKTSFYKSDFDDAKNTPFIERLKKRTEMNIKLAKITGIMLAIGLVVFFIEMFAELYLNEILFPEEPFWFYVWLTFSLFAVLLASIALQIRKTLLEERKITGENNQNDPWLFSGGGKRIYILAILNIILALGLLPFIIFPPIFSTGINGYVQLEGARQKSKAS